MYLIKEDVFLFPTCLHMVSFREPQRTLQNMFVGRSAPLNCCICKFMKKLETGNHCGLVYRGPEAYPSEPLMMLSQETHLPIARVLQLPKIWNFILAVYQWFRSSFVWTRKDVCIFGVGSVVQYPQMLDLMQYVNSQVHWWQKVNTQFMKNHWIVEKLVCVISQIWIIGSVLVIALWTQIYFTISSAFVNQLWLMRI